MEKEIIIFLRNNLSIGGIETYIYQAIKLIKSNNDIVIWVKGKRAVIDDSFLNEVFDGKTIVWNACFKKQELCSIIKNENIKNIKIISFDPYNFSKAELLKKRIKKYQIQVFYFVPNFRGENYFFEDGFKGKKSDVIRNHMSQIFFNMNANENIRYFSENHIHAMTTRYKYKIKDHENIMVPSVQLKENEIDLINCSKLYERDKFNILTVSRLDFPNKGYVIGLIKTYAELKLQFPNITLTIVGYGAGEKKVKELISKYDEFIKKDISLIGKVSPDNLINYYKDANINISLAGGFVQGASNGVLSIPARHYSYNCEVYGYLPESKLLSVSDVPGKPVEMYIIDVLNMNKMQYVKKCMDCYNTYNDQGKKVGFKQLKNKSNKSLSLMEIFYIITVYKLLYFKRYFHQVFFILRRYGLRNFLKRLMEKVCE